MKIHNRKLRRAYRWLGDGQSSKVIKALQPDFFLYEKNPLYYMVLGRAYLDVGTLKDAYHNLNEGLRYDPENVEIRLILAVLQLKKNNPLGAIRAWLDVLDIEPENKIASRGLKTLRKLSSEEDQNRFLSHFKPQRFLPRIAAPKPLLILFLLSLILALVIAFFFRNEISANYRQIFSGKKRPGTELLVMQGKSIEMEPREGILYPMQERELRETMQNAVKSFQAYQDNLARFELNKIIYSNASLSIRTAAESLRSNLGEPEIDTIQTLFSYEDVSAAPWLYNGCWVLWRGRTASVRYGEDTVDFDFLVGMDKGTVLKGRISVHLPFRVLMEPLPLELLGKVEITGDQPRLIGKTLHFLR